MEKKNAYFKKNPVFSENFPISDEIFQILTRISSFRQKFQIPVTLFSNFDAFFNSGNRSDLTDANHRRTCRFWVTPPLHPTPAGRVLVGLKTDPARPVNSSNYELWKLKIHLTVFSFHNSVFNGIFVIKHT